MRRPWFWEDVAAGLWERDTLALFDRFVDRKTVFFDIGTWAGPTTMYAAQSAAKVYSFEPDPVAFAELTRNLQLNAGQDWVERILACNQAVAHRAGTMRLGVQDSLGKSTNSLLLGHNAEGVDVEAIAFDALMDFPDLDGKRIFVKMDIEGGEYVLLKHPSKLLAREDSMLQISFHPKMLMRRMDTNGSTPQWGWIARRTDFVKSYRDIFDALPFKHYYTITGRKLSLGLQFFRALALGRFKRDVFATHRPWAAV